MEILKVECFHERMAGELCEEAVRSLEDPDLG
jgi:hypothetical protein